MIACSAVEVANRIATLQGINTEQSEPSSPTTKRCARIYSECFVKEGKAVDINNDDDDDDDDDDDYNYYYL